jgi:hypothetical protein
MLDVMDIHPGVILRAKRGTRLWQVLERVPSGRWRLDPLGSDAFKGGAHSGGVCIGGVRSIRRTTKELQDNGWERV